MGSHSSGRTNGKRTTSSCYRLVVRRWQRAGQLMARRCFVDREWRIDVAPYSDALRRPDHAIVSHWGGPVKCVVGVEWTACNYGGVRAWFRCLNAGCRRRVAILYSHNGDSFACRHCLDLAYVSALREVLQRDRMTVCPLRLRIHDPN
jgi:hypothetical protein